MNDLGQAANQIPEIAGAEYVARGADLEKLAESRTLLRNLAKGAALLTGTRLTLRCQKGPLPTVPIDGLNDAYLAAMKRHDIENRRERDVTRLNSRKPKSLGMTDRNFRRRLALEHARPISGRHRASTACSRWAAPCSGNWARTWTWASATCKPGSISPA